MTSVDPKRVKEKINECNEIVKEAASSTATIAQLIKSMGAKQPFSKIRQDEKSSVIKRDEDAKEKVISRKRKSNPAIVSGPGVFNLASKKLLRRCSSNDSLQVSLATTPSSPLVH